MEPERKRLCNLEVLQNPEKLDNELILDDRQNTSPTYKPQKLTRGLTVFDEEVKAKVREHNKIKEQLMSMDEVGSFSYDLEMDMTDEEIAADSKLIKLRDIIASKDYSCTINRFKELHNKV